MRKDCKVCGSANRSSQHRMTRLKGTKFIRVVKKSCATTIRLPSRFARNVGEFVKDGALLYGHGVDCWRVEVVHSNFGCSFGKGWSNFYEGYKIAKGSILLFKYMGYSSFKVDIFNAYSGLVIDKPVSGGTDADKGEPSREGQPEPRPVGRPRVEFQESEDVGHVRLYGMNLRKLTKYNLRAELRRRRLLEDGCKGELVERLGRFIMRHGPDFHYERIRIGRIGAGCSHAFVHENMNMDGLKGRHSFLSNSGLLLGEILPRCDDYTKTVLPQVCKEWNNIFAVKDKGGPDSAVIDQLHSLSVVDGREGANLTVSVESPAAAVEFPPKKRRLK